MIYFHWVTLYSTRGEQDNFKFAKKEALHELYEPSWEEWRNFFLQYRQSIRGDSIYSVLGDSGDDWQKDEQLTQTELQWGIGLTYWLLEMKGVESMWKVLHYILLTWECSVLYLDSTT